MLGFKNKLNEWCVWLCVRLFFWEEVGITLTERETLFIMANIRKRL